MCVVGLYGGGVAVLTALNPMGPWTNLTALLDPGCPMEEQRCGRKLGATVVSPDLVPFPSPPRSPACSTCFQMGPGNICNPVSQAQQNFVIEVPLANGSSAWVWTGDRWQQSPDGTYAEQPQTWLPLYFDEAGGILPLQWVDEFTLDVAVAGGQ